MNYLQQFQAAYGLVPDGVLGRKTAAKIKSVLGIRTDTHLAHFLGQIQVESGGFTAGRENLNYSALSLVRVFPKRFSIANAVKYNRAPERIANFVYANRNGNGNEASGDGWKYRGGGAIQITFKNNYQAYFKWAGLPVDSDPMLLTKPEHYFRCGYWFFSANGIWGECRDFSDTAILRVSRAINCGSADSSIKPNHLAERKAATLAVARLLLLN